MVSNRNDALYLAQTIRAFLDGSAGEWDWDDLTSCMFHDPHLEDIRQRALAVDLPVDPKGVAALKSLAEEAERLGNLRAD